MESKYYKSVFSLELGIWALTLRSLFSTLILECFDEKTLTTKSKQTAIKYNRMVGTTKNVVSFFSQPRFYLDCMIFHQIVLVEMPKGARER